MPGFDVLQVLSSTHRRGAETYAVALGRALARLGDDVCTVALHGAPPPALAVPALSDRRWSVPAARRLRSLTRDADVVVAHGSSTLVAAALSAHGTGTPFVYRVIGDPAVWANTPARRVRVRALLHRAAAVVTYDQGTADTVVALHGLPASRVHVLAKGIDLATHRPLASGDRAAARLSLGLDHDRTVVTWLGSLATEKRPDLALDVAARLLDADLLVVGDGPLRADLVLRLSADSGLASRVHLLGAVADPTDAIAAADVVLGTSTTEGVPGALLEAMAAGRPVVSTAVGAVPTLVADGKTGRLVDDDVDAEALADGLAVAVDSIRTETAVLGAAARDHVEAQHDLRQVAAAWSELLHRLALARR